MNKIKSKVIASVNQPKMKRSNSCLTLPILYEKSHYEDSNFFYFKNIYSKT